MVCKDSQQRFIEGIRVALEEFDRDRQLGEACECGLCAAVREMRLLVAEYDEAEKERDGENAQG